MTRKPIISIIGNSNLPPDDKRLILAERLGTKLVDSGYRILTGGLGGIMEAASRGARSSSNYQSGDIIGILPGFDPDEANQFVDIPIATGLDHLRNQIVANSDAVIAIGGGAGTLTEIGFAWMLKRMVIAYNVEGISGRLANTCIDHRIRYSDLKDDRVYGVSNENEVIMLLTKRLKSYQRRHHGIK